MFSGDHIHKSKEPRTYLATSKDGGVLFDPGTDRLLRLNEAGTEMWKRLIAGATVTSVAEAIATEYGVPPHLVEEDVRQLLASAAQQGISPASTVLPTLSARAAEDVRLPHFPWYGQNLTPSHSKSTPWSVAAAIAGLAAFDFVLQFFSLKNLCAVVKAWPVSQRKLKDKGKLIGKTCAAVERACVWYPKKAVCLQRSAVTTCLLRTHGIAAHLVVGVRSMPFLAHAWVEVEGTVVNDFPKVVVFYQTIASY